MTQKQASSASHVQPASAVHKDSQIYSDGLTIEEGDVFTEDVVVLSGNIRVKTGAVVEGNLVTYSGNIRIDADAIVEGDVTSWSGNLDIDGTVQGDLAVFSGDINLGEAASIGGDISVMSGSIHRERGAIVEGNVVAGDLKMPQLPAFFGNAFGNEVAAPDAPIPPAPPAPPVPPMPPVPPAVDMAVNRAGGWGSGIFALFGRLVAAALGASLIIFLTALLYHLRPGFIHAVQQTMHTQRPLSFAVGITSNVVLIFLTSILVITLCLAPVGLAAGLVFGTINLIGWVALSLTVGGRLLRAAKIETQPLVEVVIGAFLMTGVLALGWAVGGCIRPLAMIASLAISAFGGGAVIVYWLKLGANKTPAETALSV